MDTVSIFIGDLSYFCIEADLVRLCEQFGTVTSAIVRRGRHGDTLHYAFVKMASADAHETIRRLQGMKFMGRPIRVGLNVPAPQIANDQRSLWAQIYVSFQTRSVRMQINEEFLDAMFSRIGYVQDCVVKHYEVDVNPHRQVGYGFVYFAHQDDALRAIRHFKQQTVDGVYFDCNACFTAAPPTATVAATPPPPTAAAHVPLPPPVNTSLGGAEGGQDADAEEERARKAQETSPRSETSPTSAAQRLAAGFQRSPHASQSRPNSHSHSHSHSNAPYAAQQQSPHAPALTIVSSRSLSTAGSAHNLSSHSSHSMHSGGSSASSPFAASGRPPALAIGGHSFHGPSPAVSPYAQQPPPPPQQQPQQPPQPQQSPQPSSASAPPVGTPVATLLPTPGTPHAQPLPPGHFLQHSLPAPAAAPFSYAQHPPHAQPPPQLPSPTSYGGQFHGGHPQQLMAQLPLAAVPLHSLPVPAQAYYYPLVQPHGHAHAPIATPAAPLMVSAAGVPPPYALPGDYPPHYQQFGESKSSAMAPPFDFYATNAPPMAAPVALGDGRAPHGHVSSMYIAQNYAYEPPAGQAPAYLYYAAPGHGGDSCGPDAPPGAHPSPRYSR